jgi:hypothetical protein
MREKDGHANALVIDLDESLIFRFEPHGSGRGRQSIPNNFEKEFADIVSQRFGRSFVFAPFHQASVANGPQTVEYDGEVHLQQYDPRERPGYCEAWTLMFIDYFATYGNKLSILEIQEMMARGTATEAASRVRDYVLYMYLVRKELGLLRMEWDEDEDEGDEDGDEDE